MTDLQCSAVARLQHDSRVWKVEWSMLGLCLAVGTERRACCVWKADFLGNWVQVCLIQGTQDAGSLEA